MQDADGQLLRNALSAAGQVSADRRTPILVSQAFEYLFEGPHCLYEFQVRIGGELSTTTRRESMLALELGENGGEDFNNTLLFNYFNYQDDSGGAHNLKFLTPPNDLLIQLKRAYQSRDPATNRFVDVKNVHPAPVPPYHTGSCLF